MKKFTPLCVAFLFAIFSTAGNAQTLKFGHIDLQALIQVMPERETTEAEFTKFQADLEDILGEMQKDYQTKLGELELLYVFETSSNVVLYKSNQSIDLLPLVKQKLGIE